MSPIDDAIEDLKSQKPGESINYTQIAAKYGVDRTTLSRRWRGLQSSMQRKIENSRLLNDTQERALVEYIDTLTGRGLPPTRQMIRNFASEIAQKEAGKQWVDRFIKRHENEVLSRWATPIDIQRKRADSAPKYKLYFELLRTKIAEHKIDMRHTYNMDEKGFLIGILSKQKRLFSRRKYEEGGIKQIIQDGNREWITTIACVCADGTSLPPGLIYKAGGNSIQDSWLEAFDPAKDKAFFTCSTRGWTNNEIGLKWLEQVFNKETQKKTRLANRLLIVDGHGSHVTKAFIDYCDAHKIYLAIYPPHSTHTLQPLDVGVFGALATAYSHQLSNFLYISQGLTSVTKRDFFRLFQRAWDDAITPKNILSAFEKCGIHPFNPARVLSRFEDKTTERPFSSDSSTSAILASDWRKIERLLREVVVNIYDEKAAALSQSIHSMAVEVTLLSTRLVNSKKLSQLRRRAASLVGLSHFKNQLITMEAQYGTRQGKFSKDEIYRHKRMRRRGRKKKQKRLLGYLESSRSRRRNFRLKRGSVQGRLQRRRSLQSRLKRELRAGQK